LNDAIKRLANRIRESLKIQQDNIQKNKEEATNSSLQQNDQKIRLTQVQAQTKQFQKVWNEYNDSQLDFRKESKTTLIRQAKITGNIHLTDEKVEEMIDKGKVYILG
jgi:t-SNARE complex subunit (syntaxin)